MGSIFGQFIIGGLIVVVLFCAFLASVVADRVFVCLLGCTCCCRCSSLFVDVASVAAVIIIGLVCGLLLVVCLCSATSLRLVVRL